MGSSGIIPSKSVENATKAGLQRFSSLLANMPSRFYTRELQVCIDLVLSALAVLIAYRLRFDTGIPVLYQAPMWGLVLAFPMLRVASIHILSGYEIIWRYFSFRDAQLLALASLPPSVFLLILRLTPIRDELRIPLGVLGIEYFGFMFLAGGIRGLRRLTYESSRRTITEVQDAIVLGTGSTLSGAMHQIALHPEIRVVGLLACEENLKGKQIHGITVLGSPTDLASVLVQQDIKLVLVSDAQVPELSECVAVAGDLGVEIRLLPSASDVIHGEVRVAARPKPELVLAKTNSQSEQRPEVIEAFRDRIVLITGAGGSIGSEISRQVAQFPVRKILLLDQDENSIFEIHNRLQSAGTNAPLVQIVGDIRNVAHMRRVFGTHLPDVVLHAAAYKHVPVMEVNRCQAILNNVIGTRVLADLSMEFEVGRFLMISTDKAVRPTSVMGATKRVAEILVKNRAARPRCRTRFGCVRFGNVVGSRGSVVPIFLRQIAEGGPVTITHELMTRYFMTIPEAVQLVLQAATLASSGELYMLDMGDPMRIMDVARKLIESSGLRPGVDIQIKITGIRQGEKLHEQLWLEDTNTRRTQFGRVYEVIPSHRPPDIEEGIQELERLALNGAEDETFRALVALPIDFREMDLNPALLGQEQSVDAATAQA